MKGKTFSASLWAQTGLVINTWYKQINAGTIAESFLKL
jgi:hypothetical protein